MSRAPSPAPRPRAPRLSAAERRRELARTAAVEFHRRGFHQVTIGGVAAAVGLTAPAVYRHYANKNALLAGAVDTGLEEIEAAMAAAAADGGSLDDLLRRLTTAALRRPDFWTLLQREVRHLDDTEQQHAHSRFLAVRDELAAALTRRTPDLDPGERDVLVTAALAVMATPSTFRSALPDERLAPILAAAARAACTASIVTATPPGGAPEARESPPRRAEQIRDTAFALFHRHGYAAVSLDDIGAAVGIAGPSIYHHYGSKAELLVAAFDRVLDGLPAVDGRATGADALRDYVDLALREREAIGTRATEMINLPADDALRIERALAADLAAWTAMLRRERPALDDDEAALLVEAARSAVHDVVRLGRLHRRPTVRDELLAVGTAVLDAAPPTQ
ncbi:TetR/AcrR family transcriptional regulator [Actinomycetospora endophytica]|uniref:TetR/AcrR family transcriptional regulator n=1 Tax=Actinomycetospora endophytica TaxID=2291215 RepID=A0ABS8PAJ1_9PSEU|nr:TetR/AcrR family transcriptional regulator [Actinomycetospora endophytica]MCD2195139.1 TetR/AcrR family transcriptional regulator [Actinomycetospora endophytica]